MTILRKNSVENSTRGLLIIISLMAVMFFSSVLVFVGRVDTDSDSRTFCDIVLPGKTRSMAGEPHDGRNSGSIFLTVPAVVSGYNFDEVRPILRGHVVSDVSRTDSDRYWRLGTVSFISPDKAHEFTLVGAKPSGTS